MAATWRDRTAPRVVRSGSSSIHHTVGQKILASIDEGVESRWGPALERAALTEAATVQGRVDLVTASFRHELGVAGAAAGGTSAVPGVGLGTASAAFVLELGWSTIRLTDLVLTIAALHGHRDATLDERRLWVLSILTYGDGATSMVTRLAGELGRGLGSQATSHIPAETIRQLNKAMGTAIVARYGTRRGAVALSRAVPFGIGAALGYGLNSYVVKATARHADSFFGKLPARDTSIPTTASER